jgi:hypothetical protein
MDSILELCQSLDTVCLEECQQILDNPQDSTGTQLVLPEKSLLDQALVKFRGIKETSKDVSTITCLKKLCAHSVLTVVSSPEQEGERNLCLFMDVQRHYLTFPITHRETPGNETNYGHELSAKRVCIWDYQL